MADTLDEEFLLKRQLPDLIKYTTEGDIKQIKRLFNDGKIQDMNVKERDFPSDSALHIAAREGQMRILKFLVENGGNCNIVNKENVTPLHVAVLKKDLGIIQYLVECKANVNAADESKTTPILIAARSGDLKISQFLFESGANIEVKNVSNMNINFPIILTFNFMKNDNETVLSLSKGHARLNQYFKQLFETLKELKKLKLHEYCLLKKKKWSMEEMEVLKTSRSLNSIKSLTNLRMNSPVEEPKIKEVGDVFKVKNLENLKKEVVDKDKQILHLNESVDTLKDEIDEKNKKNILLNQRLKRMKKDYQNADPSQLNSKRAIYFFLSLNAASVVILFVKSFF